MLDCNKLVITSLAADSHFNRYTQSAEEEFITLAYDRAAPPGANSIVPLTGIQEVQRIYAIDLRHFGVDTIKYVEKILSINTIE